MSFNTLGLPALLEESLLRMQFTTPTEIQSKAIPFALEGRDILGTARTGTGKTAAFVIPIIANLLKDTSSKALIMAPTRELAMQIAVVFRDLLGDIKGLRQALLIGGDSMYKQLQQLRTRPRVIIGTPGRINDHLRRHSLDLKETGFLVLDEIDRMLDMGFGVQIEEINKHIPEKRQTLMFSATLPKQILRMSENYLDNPERIEVGGVNEIAAMLKQEHVFIEDGAKFNELMDQLNKVKGATIVFVKTKIDADRISDKLSDYGFKVEAIHGDLQQGKRARVIRTFREKECDVLVATDVAARGLDVPHVEHVINYDLPQCPEDFIHRVGRTARAGAEGLATSFISNRDKKKWQDICRLLNPGKPFDSSGFKTAKKAAPGSKGEKGSGFGGDRRSGSGFGGGRDRDRNSERRPVKVYNEDRAPRSDSGFGARPSRDGDSRPARSFDRPSRDGDSRPARGGFGRPSRDGDSRPARSFDRPSRDGDSRPARSFDRPSRDGDSRPARSFDRPSRDGDSRPARSFDRPSRDGDSRPARSFDRPARDGDSRPARGGFGRPSRDGDSRPARGGFGKPSRDGDSRPARSFGKPSRDGKSEFKKSEKPTLRVKKRFSDAA